MFVPRLIAYPALWPDSTKVWGVLKVLLTAKTMDQPLPLAPGPWRGHHRRAGREGGLLRLRGMITLANQSKSFIANHSVI
jgi:hypothetical protein